MKPVDANAAIPIVSTRPSLPTNLSSSAGSTGNPQDIVAITSNEVSPLPYSAIVGLIVSSVIGAAIIIAAFIIVSRRRSLAKKQNRVDSQYGPFFGKIAVEDKRNEQKLPDKSADFRVVSQNIVFNSHYPYERDTLPKSPKSYLLSDSPLEILYPPNDVSIVIPTASYQSKNQLDEKTFDSIDYQHKSLSIATSSGSRHSFPDSATFCSNDDSVSITLQEGEAVSDIACKLLDLYPSVHEIRAQLKN